MVGLAPVFHQPAGKKRHRVSELLRQRGGPSQSSRKLDHLTRDIELRLTCGRIADPDWTRAAIPGQFEISTSSGGAAPSTRTMGSGPRSLTTLPMNAAREVA